jgi:hypothetical protein
LWFLDEWEVSAIGSFVVCSCTLLPWGIPTERSHKSEDQGSAGAKKHHRNGRSHVGGTCVEQLLSMLCIQNS